MSAKDPFGKYYSCFFEHSCMWMSRFLNDKFFCLGMSTWKPPVFVIWKWLNKQWKWRGANRFYGFKSVIVDVWGSSLMIRRIDHTFWKLRDSIHTILTCLFCSSMRMCNRPLHPTGTIWQITELVIGNDRPNGRLNSLRGDPDAS